MRNHAVGSALTPVSGEDRIRAHLVLPGVDAGLFTRRRRAVGWIGARCRPGPTGPEDQSASQYGPENERSFVVTAARRAVTSVR